MAKAKIIRGVYIKGVPYPEGAIVEVDEGILGELQGTNYAVRATEEEWQEQEAAKDPAPRKTKAAP